jgi:hypothetical protein
MLKTLILCSALTCSTSLLAQEDSADSTEGTPTEDAAEPSTDDAAKSDTTSMKSDETASPAPVEVDKRKSRTARSMKTVTVEAGGGLVIGALSGTQFDVLYNMAPDLQVGLMYGSGSLDLKSAVGNTSEVEVREAKVSGNIVGLEALYFVGNSFYTRFGLGQRSIAADINMQHRQIDYGIAGTIEANSTVFLFGIGNQWQFDSGFTIGAEWAGYTQPMSSSSSSSLKSTGSAAAGTDSDKEDLEKLKKDFEDVAESLGETGSTRLLILSLGWAF